MIKLHSCWHQVDVDDQQDVAAAHEISALPTFVFIKNGQRIDLLRGANATKLEQLIQKHSGASEAEEEESDLKLPAGHVRMFYMFFELRSNN